MSLAPDTGTRTAGAEVVIEMPISFSLVVHEATRAGEHNLVDDIRLAAADGYNTAAQSIRSAALNRVPAIVRYGRSLSGRHEQGAITVHTTVHTAPAHTPGRSYLHAHLTIDPTPVTGDASDHVDPHALAELAPVAQTDAVYAAAQALHTAGYGLTRPQASPHTWELGGYHQRAVDTLGPDGSRSFTCPPLTRGLAWQLFPIDQFDPACAADRKTGRI